MPDDEKHSAYFKAEIWRDNCIWFKLSGVGIERTLHADDYRLTDASGKEVAIECVVPHEVDDALLIPAQRIDRTRVYYLHAPKLSLRTLCRFDGWFRKLYSTKQLGANVDKQNQRTLFRLFAPRATAVRLYLYDAPTPSAEAIGTYEMQPDSSRVWEYAIDRDLHGKYYDFTVHGPSDPGNSFFETHPVHISDPYSRASVDTFGRSRILYATEPATPLKSGRPKMEDVIAYEVHVQDFTDLLPVDKSLQGTFAAMMQRGLKNKHGRPIGLDYLVDLGINTVHLMPVQEFLHYPDDEWKEAFGDDPFMIDQGINDEYYEWGYRTSHAFAIETRYRTKGSDFGDEREQFRDLVQAFHDHGLAVIIDLVPNHTAENLDGRNHLLHWNAIDKPYYYRTNDDLHHIGPFGNEVKTEDRPMVQRWLIDQCKDLINEFGIDGFRIDLAGQIDKQTLLRLQTELDDDVIIYGEPWIPPSDPEVANNPAWGWYKKDAPITFFQDDARNAFSGTPDDPKDKLLDRGFAGGNGTRRDATMMALANSSEEEYHPNRGINYLDIHDNWALADRFATRDWDGRNGVDEDAFKIAATLLLTSLGPIVLHGGTEMMRSKGLAGDEDHVRRTRTGPIFFHGKRDTYNLRAANRFIWDNLGTNQDSGAPCNYQAMLEWWQAMLAFRNSEFGRVFRIGDRPANGYFQWILPKDHCLLGYIVDKKILVLMNTSGHDGKFEVHHPEGRWRLIATNQQVDHVNGVNGPYSELHGRHSHIDLLPQSLRIWRKL